MIPTTYIIGFIMGVVLVVGLWYLIKNSNRIAVEGGFNIK